MALKILLAPTSSMSIKRTAPFARIDCRAIAVKLSSRVMVASPSSLRLSIAPSRCSPCSSNSVRLCGRYWLPDGRAGDAVELPPATTVAGIERFADRLEERGRRREAGLALRVRNSLSPMETDIAETMVFDPRMGGLAWRTGAEPFRARKTAVRCRNGVPSRSVLAPREHLRGIRRRQAPSGDRKHRGAIGATASSTWARVVTLTGEAQNYEFERVALLVASAWAEVRTGLGHGQTVASSSTAC
ncbi:MAG: hypothetical protein ACLTMP_13455 [Eggerthella lenta]